METAVIISAKSEWKAVKVLFPAAEIQDFPYGECFTTQMGRFPIRFFHAGWGKTASGGALQYIISHHAPALTVNLGTCGGFEGLVRQGEVLLVEKTFIYDLVELMGDFGTLERYYTTELDLSWLTHEPFPVRRGTIASADGDLLPGKIPHLQSRGALAADWESASLAWVANKNGARLLILRAVSDLVSPNGGEAYDNIELFRERTKSIMKMLVEQLPAWLEAAYAPPSP
jgi:adenosylhomocysteine nucleosidase